MSSDRQHGGSSLHAARQKVQGQTLNLFIVEQLRVVPPDRYEAVLFGPRTAGQIVREAVLELTYTAHDMAPFARAMDYVDEMGKLKPPFAWDKARRKFDQGTTPDARKKVIGMFVIVTIDPQIPVLRLTTSALPFMTATMSYPLSFTSAPASISYRASGASPPRIASSSPKCTGVSCWESVAE
ncbi:MAG: hypothetical protein OXI33_07380 [Chloroflexota bacterium]|nr:hypothetical protein [Chloroflexota bacterium]